MTTVATEDQEQPNPSHELEARILDVTPGCRTSSGPAETRSAPKGRTYDRSRPSRSKHQIVLAIRGRSLIAAPLSMAFGRCPGDTVLSAVGTIRRNIWSEARVLQCPQRAGMR